MYCRKKLNQETNERCTSKEKIYGYCEYHWNRYQNGLDFHDPSKDFEYVDEDLNELLEVLEKEDYFSNVTHRDRVNTDELKWDRTATDMEILGENHFSDIAKTVSDLIGKDDNKKGSLEKFSKDKENVHTAPLVQKTIAVSKKLMSLADTNLTSYDTLICILKSCNLSSKAQDNLIEHYFSNTSIYELPVPTFKKVLDGIWIYIQKYPEEVKLNLIERLRQELEDNTGTCAQGNLSRLVNTLNGFTHHVEKEVNIGDVMKELTKEPNLSIRKDKALKFLKERNVSKTDSNAWLELIML
jgi:hypothetical protein